MNCGKNNLIEARKQAGLSQRALAEKSGVSVRMIQCYEQGNRDIAKAEAATVYALAKAMGVTVENLLE